MSVTTRFVDSFTNFAASLGLGASNLLSQATYEFNYLTRNRKELDARYRGNWLVGVAVDAIAQDMTKLGVDITTSLPPEQVDILVKAQSRLKIWQSLREAVKWSRLYGGAVAVLVVDGQDESTPLDISRVGLKGFKGLMVFDRWQINPNFTNLIREKGPDYGKPIFYDTVPDGNGVEFMHIHHTRIIKLNALELPNYQRQAENYWGMSVLERINDRLIAYDSATAGVSQLVFKAYLRTWKIKGLRQLIAGGGALYNAVLKNVEVVRSMQSSEGITLIDADDDFATQTYNFSGLDSVLIQFGQQISGALEVPLVRLFGQSPAGLSSTGESDLRNYYDGIQEKQQTQLSDGVHKIISLLSLSELGRPLPADTSITFKSLWQLSDNDKATISSSVSSEVNASYTAGLIDKVTALKELKSISHLTGRWTNVTTEMIQEAEDEPPPVPQQAKGEPPVPQEDK